MFGNRIDRVLVLLFSLGCVATGCGGPAEETPGGPSGDAAPGDGHRDSAATLPIPGASGGAPSSGGVGGGADVTRLGWALPAGWTAETPNSQMRLAQYRVPGPAGDGECVVYYFGPGQGGDPMSNAHRWAGQFKQPDGSSSVDRMQVGSVEGAGVPVDLVEVTGTYDGGMTMTDAPAQSQPDYMLLGAIAQGPDAPWFFKLTGPETTIRAQREAFLEMLRSIRLQ